MKDGLHSADALIAHTVSAGATKATYTGASMTLGGWLFSSEFAVLFGMLLAFFGFIVNWYYRHRATMIEVQYRQLQDERERIEHTHRVAVLSKLNE